MFRGEDGETREPVVIKVVRVGLTPERAAVVGAALVSVRDRLPSHPALAACFDAGVVDVEPYVVSAYIDGDSLDVALREYGPALLVDALPRLRLLADGLDLAAAAGLSHGSLHPRDILVAVEHTVLQGLGVAGVLERVGVRPPVRRPYCAPEVALGLGISPAGDQYSLAAVAHEWLTGRRLTAGQEHAVRVPGLTGDAAEAMRAVFSRALAESPGDRFPSATAFVEAMAVLAPHAAGRPKPSRRPPAAAPPRLSFDEPDEPVVLAPPPGVVETAPVETARSVTAEATAASDGDPLDDADGLVAEPGGAPDAMADLPILREAPDSPVAWDDNPLSDFTVAASSPSSEAFASAADGDETADAEDDDVVPDDGIAAPPSPVIVTPAAPEPDLVAASLPIDEAGPTSWDEHDAAPGDAPAEDAAGAVAADGERAWTMWVGGIVAFTLLAVAGGWALVQWGTPSAPIQGASAAAEAPAAPAPAPLGETPRETPAASAPVTPPSTAATPSAAAPAPSSSAPSVPRTTTSARPSSPPPAPAPAGRPVSTPRPSAAPARADRPRTAPAPAPARPARPAPAAARPTPGEPASASAAAGNAARLLVRSTPGGAEVFVNGERRGVTPLALRDLPLGSYAVRITRAGYAPVDERVVLERARPSRSLEVTLTRAGGAPAPPATPPPPAARAGSGSGTTGILTVETRPPGARVTVDGNDVGATPVTLPALAAGSHRIRIERPGFTPITTTTTIEAGARARVAVTLTPERP